MKRKDNINITLDNEILEKMEKEGIKNRSQFVNEILTDYFFKKNSEKTEIVEKIDDLKAEIVKINQRLDNRGFLKKFFKKK